MILIGVCIIFTLYLISIIATNMNYSIKRLTTIVSSYIRRNILPGVKREFVILDLTNSHLGRITDNIPLASIKSILGNTFIEDSKILYTVQQYSEMDDDCLISTRKQKKSQFTYYYGLYNGKLLCDKLDKLPKDMIAFPVRNWKRAYGKIVKTAVYPEKPIALYLVDEYGNEIPYPQTGNNTKTFLIGPKYQLFLSCNPCWDMREYSTTLNEYLIDNPSYLVLMDNGRFDHFQLENINKNKYVSTSFEDINDMYIIGEINK